jgi:protein gp37
MHDTWNPWHGCKKKSEGCEHCYMYYLDSKRNINSSLITKTNNFNYPLQKKRDHSYQIQSGELIRICMTSDFFLEEADEWRDEVWDMIRIRKDVRFFILTKRPERIKEHLPSDWGDGWENVILNVTCENQQRTDERIPILFDIPSKHKGIMCAPFIGPIHLEPYLQQGQIEQVICGGENYDGARPLHYEWVKELSDSCKKFNVTFAFIETGNTFIKDGKTYHIPNKSIQAQQAYLSKLSYIGEPIEWKLYDSFMNEITKEQLYKPHFRKHCQTCGSRLICNGCSDCGKCKEESIDIKQTDNF